MTETWLCVKSPVPFCKAYMREVEDGHLTVFVGREPMPGGEKWHLSIFHKFRGRDGAFAPDIFTPIIGLLVFLFWTVLNLATVVGLQFFWGS